ncbi:MAG TPA: hypothetical protein VF062_12445 [Candidatus Limnocylindrales bacterium]
MGVLTGSYPGRTVAYLADMDAIPPSGQQGGGTQTAHVCGHDMHTTRGGQALKRYLHQTVGRDRMRTLYAAAPFNGEDFALFLDRVPGTFTYFGVRAPGAAIETSYPHYGAFDPDERAIGYGVRAMAGWLAERTHS